MTDKEFITDWEYPSCIQLGAYQFTATVRKGRKRPVTLWKCEHVHRTQNDAMSCATREYERRRKESSDKPTAN